MPAQATAGTQKLTLQTFVPVAQTMTEPTRNDLIMTCRPSGESAARDLDDVRPAPLGSLLKLSGDSYDLCVI